MSCLALIIAPILCLSRQNWLVLWICLEIRTLTFSFLIRIQRNISLRIEIRMKYFILQSRASSGILLRLLLLHKIVNLLRLRITLLFLFKLGAAPLHRWMLSIGTSLNWNLLLVISTWQKIIPIWLITIANHTMLIICSFFTILIGTLSQYKNKSSKILIIYSSVANITWILLALPLRIKLIITFCLAYFSSLIIVTWILSLGVKTHTSLIKRRTFLLTLFLAIITLSGMPPTATFIAKWLLFKELIITNNFTLGIATIILTTVNFYVYLRLGLSTITLKEKQQYLIPTTKKTIRTIIVYLTVMGSIFFSQ